MFYDIAIKLCGLNKCFCVYQEPRDRLKQFILPRIQKFLRLVPKRYYREFWAIKNLDLEIKKGSTVGIVGRNGSGKSTLLQLVCGILNPTSGSVYLNGRVAALLELGSSFNPEFSGRENVYLYASILGLKREEVNKRFELIEEFAGIGEYLDQPIKTYSTGMVVRLAFAVAINTDPDILIVDEALAVGDELFQRKCYSKIESIKFRGATILFVTHSAGTVVELCDTAILLDHGEIISIGDPKEIIGNYHKLLYAPAEKKSEVRKQIEKNNSLKSSSRLVVSSEKSNVSEEESDIKLLESYDPHLVSESVIRYETNGAEIVCPNIYTAEGKLVNTLISNRPYKYSYTVKFIKDSFDVRFGMMLKTVAGFEIGGIGSASQFNGIPFVPAGSSLKVTFTFRCLLLPGNYFLNAGCMGSSNEEDIFLHRITDAIAFRVQRTHPANEIRGAVVDFATPEYFTFESVA